MSMIRRAVAIQPLLFSLAAAPMAVHAQANQHFDLPAQPMASALLAIGSQAHVSVSFEPSTAQGRRANPVKGNYTARQALDQLLKGSGLEMVTTANGSFVIKPGSGNKRDTDHPPPTGSASSKTYSFHLQKLPLADALAAIEKSTGQSIDVNTPLIDRKTASAINGQLTSVQAINLALLGTGLKGELSAAGVMTIQPSSPDDAHALAEVNVTAKIEGLSAMRVPTELREIPQSVSVISQDTLQQQNAFQLSDALSRATGITLTGGSQYDIYARGFSVSEFHVDGGPPMPMPKASITNGGDLSEYDHIELLRGSDALFGGQGNPGATINLQRKEAYAEPAVELSLSAGSWNHGRVMLDANHALGFDGALRGRVVASSTSQGYFYDRDHHRQRKLYGTAAYNIGPDTLLTIGGSREKVSGKNMGGGVPLYADGTDAHLPRSTSLSFPGSYRHGDSSGIFTRLKQSFDHQWTWKTALSLMRSSTSDLYASPGSAVNPITDLMDAIQSNAAANRSSSLSVLADTTLSHAFEWHGHLQELMIGMDFSRATSPSTYQSFTLLGPALLNPWAFDPYAYRLVPAVPDIRNHFKIYQKQIGGYASIKLRPWSNVSIVLGGRDNYLRTRTLDAVNDFGNPNSLSTGVIVPYAGITVDLSRQYSLYASHAAIYLPAAGFLAPDHSVLPPLRGTNDETGFKAAWYQGRLNGSVALYRIHQINAPMPDQSRASDDYMCCYLAGTHGSKGFEAELSGRLTRGWSMNAGYTFNINRSFINLAHIAAYAQTAGTPMSTQTPKHLFKLWTDYRFPDAWSRLSVGGGVNAQSANYVIQNVCTSFHRSGACIGTWQPIRIVQGFHAVATLRAAYQLHPDWSLALNIDNLFDRSYYQTVSYTNNWYGTPRSAMVTLIGSF